MFTHVSSRLRGTDAGENDDDDDEGDGGPDVAADRPDDSQVDDVTEDGEDPE